jgi:hypothetical protein
MQDFAHSMLHTDLEAGRERKEGGDIKNEAARGSKWLQYAKSKIVDK